MQISQNRNEAMTEGVVNPSMKRRGPLTLLMTSRKFRRGFAAALIGLLLLYVGSFGPMCWWKANKFVGMGSPETVVEEPQIVPLVFFPLGWLMQKKNGGIVVHDALSWWVKLGMDPGEVVSIPIGTADGDRRSVLRIDPEWAESMKRVPSRKKVEESENAENIARPE